MSCVFLTCKLQKYAKSCRLPVKVGVHCTVLKPPWIPEAQMVMVPPRSACLHGDKWHLNELQLMEDGCNSIGFLSKIKEHSSNH